MSEIEKKLPQGDAHLTFEQELTIKHYLKEINHFLSHLIANHTNSLFGSEIALLNEAREQIAAAQASLQEPKRLRESIQLLQEKLETPFKVSSVYLLRHPEKPSKKDLSANPDRKLSLRGVRQAKKFAEYLAEEVLSCPRPVKISLFCSELRRTYLFAEIIRRKITQRKEFENKKNITIEAITQHPALAFRFTGPGMDQLREVYKSKGEMVAFEEWIDGKYDLVNYKQVARELEAWKTQATRESCTDAWHIVVGVSHSFIIDALLRVKIGAEHTNIIGLADFIRFVGDGMKYNKEEY